MEKIAIIDLGSQLARLVIANVTDDGYFMVCDDMREQVKLSQDMEWDGFLKPNRVAHALKVLKMFRKLCDTNGVEKVFAYATSAVRRAKNQKGFLDEVAVTCGIKLKVLTEEEEAGLIYSGVINTMDIPKGLILDICGGSIQLVYYYRRNLLAQASLPFGAVTVAELFKDATIDTEEQMKNIQAYVKEHLDKIEWLKDVDPETQLIGVGGAFRNIGRMSRMLKRYPIDISHNYHMTMEDLAQVYEAFKNTEVDSNTRIRGLSSVRADIFPSALATISALLETVTFSELAISDHGIRDGALFRTVIPTTAERPISDVLGFSLNSLVRQYNLNIPHAEHVYNIAMQLFKQLKVLHKLPRMYVKVLRVAAILHDAGECVDYNSHNIHSMYMIHQSDIYGISQREKLLAGFVAKGHHGNDLTIAEMMKYKDILHEEDYDAVRKLGVILKIAESFDRSKSGIITGISCDLLGDSVILKIESEADASLEVRSAMSSCAEFKRAFKKNLEIL